jgi:hypothetical protein
MRNTAKKMQTKLVCISIVRIFIQRETTIRFVVFSPFTVASSTK